LFALNQEDNMAEEPKTKSKEEIKDLPEKEKPLTPDDLGHAVGGTIPPIAGVVGGIGLKPKAMPTGALTEGVFDEHG
jgi:hypothetical protein